MKFLSLLLALLFITPVNYELKIEGNSVYGNACRYNIQGWIYVHIEGDAYERGYQHGWLLYAEITDMIYRWSNIIHNCPFIIKYLPVDINSSRYEELSARWWNECKKLAIKIFWPYYPEEYREEIRGIADGAKARGVKIYGEDITYEDILALNEMYELMSILTNFPKGFHILRDIFNAFSFKTKDFYEFALSFYPVHHCNGFAAVGNATKDGNIVISDSVWCGGWWYSYYIAQRWNVILDIEPSSGHRLIISTSPGYIWSDEDFWQNDEGLAMIETTFIQGFFKLRGIPLAIRARMAIQYGSSIDDVIKYLLEGNTGVMNAQWLIADAEEKEIALLEFGLYHHNVIRKKDGFLWSANNPFDFKVRRDIIGYEVLKAPFFRLAHLLLNATGYQYYTLFYTPSERDIKFEELGNQYYGKIDAEVVKKIMFSPPITDFTTDCKITDGNLIFNNSLWAFFGNPTYIWNTSSLNKLKGVVDVPPAGWVRIDGVAYNFTPNFKKNEGSKGREGRLLWTFEFGDKNYDYAILKSDGKNIYACFNKTLYVLSENGSLIMEKSFGEEINDLEIKDGIIYVATDKISYSFSIDGKSLWKGEGGKEIEVGDKIYLSNDLIKYRDKIYYVDGNKIYCDKWSYNASGKILSLLIEDNIYFGAIDGIYCLNKNGELKWKLDTGWGIVDIDCRNEIYAACLDGNLYCIDKNGELKWIFSTNASLKGIDAYGDKIFVSSTDGRFYAVNKSGKVDFSFSPAYEINGLYNFITTPISKPVITNGKVFFSAIGKIYCMDAETFEVLNEENNKGISLIIIIILIAIIGLAATYLYKRK
ncbi:MAG: PQQ-binding-like beta-propeller repeat protein [Thermoplasmatales archaeon]|nr:PQQ-binding-like beta-propeller repeat protein [Thermoplasmatales archaeon]